MGRFSCFGEMLVGFEPQFRPAWPVCRDFGTALFSHRFEGNCSLFKRIWSCLIFLLFLYYPDIISRYCSAKADRTFSPSYGNFRRFPDPPISPPNGASGIPPPLIVPL